MTTNKFYTTVAVIALTAGTAFAQSETDNMAGDTEEVIEQSASDAATEAEQAAEATADAAGDAAQAAEETAESAAQETEESAEDMADATEETADEMDSTAGNAMDMSDDAAETDTAETEMDSTSDPAVQSAETDAIGTSPFAGMMVGDLIGQDVYGTNGEEIGEIDYIVERGDSFAGVVGIGGFLGLGEYTVAIPLEEFRLAEGDNSGLVLNSWTEDELRAQPEFDETGVEGLAEDTPLDSVQ